ncbi:MAG: hypothetical protein J5685_04050, partial [Clostridiales bacterium]|nr:hypothetical protein [Clostridiales bacterium]
VTDKNGEDKYRVKGEEAYLTKNIHICDLNYKSIALVQRVKYSIPAEFTVKHRGKIVERINGQVHVPGSKYIMPGRNWVIIGMPGNFVFNVYYEKRKVAVVSRDYNPLIDKYVVSYIDPKDEILLIALTVALDTLYGNFKSGNGS